MLRLSAGAARSVATAGRTARLTASALPSRSISSISSSSSARGGSRVMRAAPAQVQFQVQSLQQRALSSAAASAGTFLDQNEVTERVLTVLKNFEKVDPAKVSAKSHFIKDLGLDSLDTVELVMAFEEEFVLEIPDDQAEKILTAEDAIKFIAAHPQAR